jgi:hypothetical protein
MLGEFASFSYVSPRTTPNGIERALVSLSSLWFPIPMIFRNSGGVNDEN